MSDTSSAALRKILAFAAIVEAGTGLAAMLSPAVVVEWLLGAEVSAVGTVLVRCFGIALLALGLACWPSGPGADRSSPAFRAMLTYNALIALYLAGLGIFERIGGWLLWPAVVLHAVVALWLVWAWRGVRRAAAPTQ